MVEPPYSPRPAPMSAPQTHRVIPLHDQRPLTWALPDATSRSEPYWDQYRVDSLSKKDRETYKVLDSLGKAQNFDKMAKFTSQFAS